MRDLSNGYEIAEPIGLRELLTALRPSLGLGVALACVGGLLGLVYSQTAASVYSARAVVLLQPDRIVTAQGRSDLAQISLDSSELDSQVQIIQSERIATPVIDALHLAGSRDLRSGGDNAKTLAGRVKAWIEGASTTSPSNPASALSEAMDDFERHLSVRRIGQSYAMEIAFSSASPTLSAKVTNSIAAAYIRDQLIARAKYAEAGNEVMERRISGLKAEIAAASASIESGQIDVGQFPVAEARVLTAASPPLGRSWPKTKLTILLGAFLGLLCGMAASVLFGSASGRSSRTR